MIVQITTPQLELWRIEGEFVNLPHFHDNEYQITIPIYGSCLLTQENKNYRLVDGSGLVQHPQDHHYFEIGTQSSVLVFKINQNSLKELARSEEIEFALRQQFDPSFLSEKFRKWMSALLAYDPTDRLAQEEMESQVLYYLYGALSGNHKSNTDLIERASLVSTDPFMGNVLEYIHAQYTNEVEIDTLASIALQSRYHFIRSFKAAFGVTPYQYVLRLRMDEAKLKLQRSGMSITDISLSLGFSSVSQFYRAFVKAVGSTPEQFRNSFN
ncbi:helix-turn-helix domain-containing protein [Paenibacillus radicis (ex Xue et al. 2023)]|uniref:AraC family transcriptional regulator n=1 Tax=Paenibacillus radicis (ex Xue et al. 2023) TaxID=2972489 RepID=A0ABT1YKJ4_9BACL|nr:AraC family transcriptional regulator [Paenibacillus radicis (ex Xue et al. 2023)]MCR8633708.1 AraC family transcriptional regulator [Paenibacillus radicis (ex Xue et al. 2023)]